MPTIGKNHCASLRRNGMYSLKRNTIGLLESLGSALSTEEGVFNHCFLPTVHGLLLSLLMAALWNLQPCRLVWGSAA